MPRMRSLWFLAAALERLRESVPQQTLRQQPRLFDQSQRQFGLCRVMHEFDRALAQWCLAGSCADRPLRWIVNDAVFRTPKLFHTAEDLSCHVGEGTGTGHRQGSRVEQCKRSAARIAPLQIVEKAADLPHRGVAGPTRKQLRSARREYNGAREQKRCSENTRHD